MKISINEHQLSSIIGESKMRCWKYIDKINAVVDDIINRKSAIINNKGCFTYSLPHDVTIDVYDHETFLELFPHMKNASGFCRTCGDGKPHIFIYVEEWMVRDTLKDTLMHEYEHALDRILNPEHFRGNYAEMCVSDMYHRGGFGERLDTDDNVYNETAFVVKYFLYRYWMSSERNAYTSEKIINDSTSIEYKIKQDINRLNFLKHVDAKAQSRFWYDMRTLIDNRKGNKGIIPIEKLNNPTYIKNYFIRKTYDKIKRYEKTLIKKLRYAKMNNIGIGKNTPFGAANQKEYWYFNPETQQSVGPFSYNQIAKMVRNNKLPSGKSTLIWNKDKTLGLWTQVGFVFPQLYGE